MDACGTRLLRQTLDQDFDFFGRDVHEVGKFIDDQ